MPELPEVETTLRGIAPHVVHQTITQVIVRHYGLRWPIPRNIAHRLVGQHIAQVGRRGKYILLHLKQGALMIHLGMSGTLRILNKSTTAQKHDHVDVILDDDVILRFTDPRRFGAFLWIDNPHTHALLKHLGPEPLTEGFCAHYLWQRAQHKKIAVKTLIMDQKMVVGVGNIYANEALFLAKIHPLSPAKSITLARYEHLVLAIKSVLAVAITKGGTTLKDFLNSEGKPGYFSQHLHVYGRVGKPCTRCQATLVAIQLGQRNTVFCPSCQQ